MAVLGYARVSTAAQKLEIQLALLKEAGCSKFFFEKQSGVKDDRRALKRMLRTIKPGDVVVVPALDRLTRGGSFKTLLMLDEITSRGGTYRSLAEPCIEATNELAELFAALVGYIGRKTREDIMRRTAAGREKAKQIGVKFGRKPKLNEEQRSEAIALRASGESHSNIAARYNVSPSTISRLRVWKAQ